MDEPIILSVTICYTEDLQPFYHARVRIFLFLLIGLLSAPALAQQKGPWQGKGQNMTNEDRRKLREDVDSAKGTYGRPDRGRQGRMDPDEREKLRRDVQDANKDMRRR